MTIHVVQSGDTLDSIANQYNVSVDRLAQNNDLNPKNELVIGQAIVILHPLKTYTVKEDDTLTSIADENAISVMQLLQNNPYLAEREFIYPGETLVISYEDLKEHSISINGYAYPYINMDALKKTLPYLTYLTIFNYRVTIDGNLIDIDDERVIRLAKDYGVAPIMSVSTLTVTGVSDMVVANSIIYNEEVQDRLISNIIDILQTKGYYGVNVYFQYFAPEIREELETYLRKLTNRINQEGYLVAITLTPSYSIEGEEVVITKYDYSVLGEVANAVLLASYEWGFSYEPPEAVTSVYIVNQLLDYAVNIIPPDKLFIGIPIIAYDWQLPYVQGVSRANSLTNETAIDLAREVESVIQYDQTAEAPFFVYETNRLGVTAGHIVWFKDARSIQAYAELVIKYGIQGISIWTIMSYFDQLWLVLNSIFTINKVLDNN